MGNRAKNRGGRMTDELENALKRLPGAGVVQTRLDGYWMESADLNVYLWQS